MSCHSRALRMGLVGLPLLGAFDGVTRAVAQVSEGVMQVPIDSRDVPATVRCVPQARGASVPLIGGLSDATNHGVALDRELLNPAASVRKSLNRRERSTCPFPKHSEKHRIHGYGHWS